MPIVLTRDGTRGVLWEPTTDLICSGCREPFLLKRDTLGKVNFMFDYVVPDPLERGEYWYLHKQCARIEDALRVNWGWLGMSWVLGVDKVWNHHFGNAQKALRKRLPPGVYDRLYEAWLPAIKPELARKRMKENRALIFPGTHQTMMPASPRTPRGPGAGYVYILHCEGTPRIKIGRSIMAAVRFESLRTASPYPLVLLRTIPTADMVALEKILHRRYAAYRQHGEWFDIPPEILAALLQEEFE